METSRPEPEQSFSQLFESSSTPEALIRLSDECCLSANPAFATLTGFTLEEVVGRSFAQAGILPGLELRQPQPGGIERELRDKSGRMLRVLATVDSLSLHGEAVALVRLVDQSNCETGCAQLAHVKKLYTTLSHVNQAVTHARHRDDLFRSICEVAVEHGQFSIAWIGLLDEVSGEIRPVASSGADLEHWPVRIANIKKGPHKNGLIANAIRTSRVVTNRSVIGDKGFSGVRDWIEKNGFHSAAAIPFALKGRMAGVLALLAHDASLFKTEEDLQLLGEIGQNTSFALEKLDAETELRESEARYRGLFEHMSEGYAYCRMEYQDGVPQDWTYLFTNDAFGKLTGLHDVLGKRATQLLPGIRESDPQVFEIYSRVALSGRPEQFEMFIEALQMWLSIAVYSPGRGYFVAVFDVITERKLAQEKLQASERALKLFVEFAPAAIAMFDREMRYMAASRRYLADYRLGTQDIIGRSHYEVFPEISDAWRQVHKRCLAGAIEKAEEDPFPRADGSLDWVRWEIHPWYETTGEIGGVILFSEVLTKRKETAEAMRESQRQMTALVTSLDDLVVEFDRQGKYLNVWAADEHLLAQPKSEMLGRRVVDVLGEQTGRPFAEAIERVLSRGRREDLEYVLDVIDGKRTFLARISPILAPDGRYQTASMLIRDITEHKRADEQINKQLARLNSLREIDTVISSSFDLKFSLDAIVSRAVKELNVDAADVLVLDPATRLLEYQAGCGFRSMSIQETSLQTGEGLAGRCALDRKPLHIRDLRETDNIVARKLLLTEERFVGYYCVPLINKRELKGVLEIFRRSALTPTHDWIDFLQTLAGQIAIAIESTTLFEGLQRSNMELGLAYDETIEGWSRALDLRDRETEGHTQRVTEVTVRLARAYGFNHAEIQHIRRGALLHDIGKLGVPDEILLKPGPLTEQEWVEMRKHPQFGYDLLNPIRYLKPALDIPYCHHEKWDGSGYPRGLEGDQIPLAARLFAVVDVWDALHHSRPYRAAWSQERVLQHIHSLSGTHFDPQAVALFFQVISENGPRPDV